MVLKVDSGLFPWHRPKEVCLNSIQKGGGGGSAELTGQKRPQLNTFGLYKKSSGGRGCGLQAKPGLMECLQ